MAHIFVAGIRNKYMGDDGFGPRVIKELLTRELPENVIIVLHNLTRPLVASKNLAVPRRFF